MSQNAAAKLSHKVVDGLGSVIERRNNGKYLGAGLVGAQHILQVNPTEWRIPHGEDQLSPLLQADVCRPLNESGGNAVCHLGQTSRTAWNHYHAIDRIRATRNARGAGLA